MYISMCVTLGRVVDASHEVWRLSGYVSGSLGMIFVDFTVQLFHAIQAIDDAGVVLISDIGWWDWVAQVGGWFQKWSGSLAMAILGCLGIGVCFWALCQLKMQFTIHAGVTQQALLAVSAHTESTQVWIQKLNKR